MTSKFLIVLSATIAVAFCGPTGGKPSWDKKMKTDPVVYSPPAYANCSSEVNECIRNLHTGARKCLKIMFSDPSFKKPGCSKWTNPTFQGYHNAMFDNSTSWHSDMYACMRNQSAPSTAKDVVCNTDPVPPKDYSGYANPELAKCWEERSVEKQACMANVASCPILATCMGVGDAAQVEGKQADWFCYIKNKRRATKIASRIYSQKMKECRENLPN